MKTLLQFLDSLLNKLFFDSNSTALVMTLTIGAIILFTFGAELFPVIVAMSGAYVCAGLAKWIHYRVNISYRLSRVIAFGIGLLALGIVVPIVYFASKEAAELAAEIPSYIEKLRIWVANSNSYVDPELRAVLVDELSTASSTIAGIVAEWFGSQGLQLLGNVLTLVLYVALIPILSLLFMIESASIKRYMLRVLPDTIPLRHSIWRQTDQILLNYIQSKMLEIAMVSLITYIVFLILGLEFAIVLAFLSGISVLIPFIGALAVAVPVAGVALSQFGFSDQSILVLSSYLAIQLLDGYVLVPWLFAQTMRISPLVILLSVIIFGSLWGLWGAFFAVPLATFLGVLIEAWQSSEPVLDGQTDEPSSSPPNKSASQQDNKPARRSTRTRKSKPEATQPLEDFAGEEVALQAELPDIDSDVLAGDEPETKQTNRRSSRAKRSSSNKKATGWKKTDS